MADTARLPAVKLVFVGDSITDFWLLGDDPWIPGRMHGRRVWDESFGGAVPQNHALNIGISGDRTEHLLFSILPRTQGGLGELDAAALAPEFFVLMVGINNSYAPEAPVADSVYEGVLAVMRSLHARKPATRLLLQSILPTAQPSRDDTVVRPVNARLAALAKSPEFASFTIWLDLYPSFVDAKGRQDALLTVAASVFYTPSKHKNHEQDTSIALKQLNSRSHVMATSLGGALALCAAQALAALGREPTVPVPFSASSTPAARGLAAASGARSGLYTSHPLQLENGTVVQEYATLAGQVFAVSWRGPVLPDLSLLLGEFFRGYKLETDQARALGKRGSIVNVANRKLIVRSTGRMRSFAGYAYAPELIPAGVNIHDVLQ